MEHQSLAIEDIKLIIPKIFRDERGFFSETFNLNALEDIGISENFVQDNHSLSVEKGVVRGLHFQAPPHAQDKLVRVVKGSILDVAVDIRNGSPTYGKHVSVILSASNWQQLWVPKGFAHGFCTLEPNTEVIYKVTDYYAPSHDFGVRWNDPTIGIDWSITESEVVLSEKDQNQPWFEELDSPFDYKD